jgi:8-oxo-dGTP pyrophosphatase MutT (NUDIX family)
MEIWDLYNEGRELTGRDHIRGEEIPPGYYHLVVHVWIRNAKGEYLISQRSADRPTLPLKWECVGGSVLKGETSLEGALRETLEEVGLTLKPENGKCVFTVVGRMNDGVRFSDILDVWLFHYDGPLTPERALTNEVARSFWMDKKGIRELYDGGKLVHTLGYFFETEGLS